MSDPEDVLAGVVWEWERSADESNWHAITGPGASRYTATESDLGHWLRVTATYTDAHGPGKVAQAVTAGAVQSSRDSGGGGGGGGGGSGGGGGGGGGSGSGGSGGGSPAGVEISGPAFAASGAESVFTVTGDGGLQTLSWTAAGPEDFTASGHGERFALTAPAGGAYTIAVTATDTSGETHTATLALSVLGDIAAHRFAHEIVWLAEEGITRGCTQQPLRYCPDAPVTRAQMASFLTRALDLQTPQQPAGFDDVDPNSAHAASIEALYATRITVGCTQQPLRYCPNRPNHPSPNGQLPDASPRPANPPTASRVRRRGPQQRARRQHRSPLRNTDHCRLHPTAPALLPKPPNHPSPDGGVPVPLPAPHRRRQPQQLDVIAAVRVSAGA